MENNYQESNLRRDVAFTKVCKGMGFNAHQIDKIKKEKLLDVSFDGQVLKLSTPLGDDSVSYETLWKEKDFKWQVFDAKVHKTGRYLIDYGTDGFPRCAYLCTQEHEGIKGVVGKVGRPNQSSIHPETLEWVVLLDAKTRGKLSKKSSLSRYYCKCDISEKQIEALHANLEAIETKEKQIDEKMIAGTPPVIESSSQPIVETKPTMDSATYFRLTSQLILLLHKKGVDLTDPDLTDRFLAENNMLLTATQTGYGIGAYSDRPYLKNDEEKVELLAFTPIDIELPELGHNADIKYGVAQGSPRYTSWLTQIPDDEVDHLPIFTSIDRQSRQVFIPKEDFYGLLKRVSNKN